MKRLVAVVVILSIVVVALAVAGCSNKGLIGPSADTEQASSCVTCHTDKDTLKAVASTETEKATSEETTGEG